MLALCPLGVPLVNKVYAGPLAITSLPAPELQCRCPGAQQILLCVSRTETLL